jgi:type I restriction enzyme, S subunit
MASAPSTPKASWEVKPLGEIAIVGAGNSAPQNKNLFENGSYPFIRTSDVGKIRIGSISSSSDLLNSEGIVKLKEYRKGTILFPKSGASTFLNHRVIMDVDGYVSSHLATIKGDPTMALDRFLLFFLITIKAQDLIQDHKYPSLKLSDIKQIPIPVPPLAEQERIVGILDEAFEGIAAATAQAEKNLHNARELFQSVLQSTFSQKGDDWGDTTLGEVCSKIGSGATPRGGKNAYKTEGISLIRSLNVYDREFRDAKLAFIDEDQADKLSNVVVEEGDVLLNITGASVARCCVAPAEHLPARVNQHVSIIRTLPGTSIPSFLNQLLTSKEYKDQLLGIGNKGGATRQAITKAEIQDFKVALPSLPTQQAIVEKLDGLSEETKALEAIYERKQTALAELKQSLLQKAFAGEL